MQLYVLRSTFLFHALIIIYFVLISDWLVLIDRTVELARLKKEIEKLEKIKLQTEARLNNSTFIEKAPENVIAEVREQLKLHAAKLSSLQEQYKKIEALVS